MLFLFSVTWGTISGWWALPCLAVGILYAWLLYKQPTHLSNRFRYGLAVVRALAVTIIALLLLSPLVKTVSYQPQKPLVLIAQDNSASIAKFNPAGTNLKQVVADLDKLKETLGDKYDVREFHFDKNLQPGLSSGFKGKQTDVSSALHQLNEQYVNQNIGALILATDGLYNQGSDPQYEARNLKASIYTVALGDTTIRRDLRISNINYNKTALLGNDFELEVETEAYLSAGETMQLNVTEDGKSVQTKNIPIDVNNWHKTIPLKLNADKKGLHKFTFNLAPVKNEVSLQNNTETIYIDDLDARQKILLVYSSPHPDISTIKQSIENNRNYELKTVSVDDLSKVKLSDYNLLILHQVTLSTTPTLQKYISSGTTPVWYMAGAQTNILDFDLQQKLIKITANRPDLQEAFALPQTDFSSFTLSDSVLNKLKQFPPLLAPFGSYNAGSTAAVLFKQKIGNIVTQYPLWAFEDDRGRRTAVLTGEGLWRWQLAEYQLYGNHNALDELLSQSIQYLTANANRQRFRVYTAKNVFDESEHVLINAELYNEALALVNTPDVKLDLKDQKGKNYSYQFSRAGQSYQLDAGILVPGEYTYTATTQIGKQKLSASGQFSVKSIDLEARQSTANHQLLRNLSKQSGGQMLRPTEIGKLTQLIRQNENIKTLVNEDKRYNDLIDIKWVFVLILALLSAEWFLRKREGEI
ncbi:hypothetical protein [Mucilaginibacter jinjuensis]|uniref:VWA domain-containing protein n=1 Tax=Mucilaginibacter jinjuensis TaxID=1176721 RepID=A0ABY7TA63_9SPHI|nr:hypothetical protein [Mucilaginibacter jinjuensis]WCT13089.1 hypothetical protein PQO05_03970 [Mucilaginibacter jinjuensis]